MPYLIAIQAGHSQIASNCDVNLRRGTGAPGESEFTVRIRNALVNILLLIKKPDGTPAFMTRSFDANANCEPNIGKIDYSLFLACHFDANIYGEGGGFIDFPEPSTDLATGESQRIVREMEAEYFRHSGIVNKPNRRNANTKFYYMWKFLSAKTPCVIIECGVGQDPHDKVIITDTVRVVNALVRGICRAFNVPFDVPLPPPFVPDYRLFSNTVKLIMKDANFLLSKREKQIKELIASSGI